ncbi:sensor histidine kinase [Streptomyces qinglanensis]|uniref:sensor histidine kinase n=1 Tax=Streptomyces qinglanensis TaxID=943816 RepID=UPI001EF78A76|nr:histidine kinase [Streptomyces qinglanensis]
MTETRHKTFQGGLYALHQELFAGALAARRLPPLPVSGPVAGMLSGRVRSMVSRLPHLAIGASAAVLVWLSWSLCWDPYDYAYRDTLRGVLLGLATAGPLVLALFRPIAAWWLSLGGIVVVTVPRLVTDPLPFPEPVFISHLTVMVLVALRSHPAVAAVLWLCTVVVGAASAAPAHDLERSNLAAFSLWAALALIGAVFARAWYDLRVRAAASHDASLAERSKRTVLEERTTIARELHDVVAHHMSVVAIQAEAAPYRVESIPPELAASLATIRENAVAALAELRRVLGVIRASDYGAPGAPEAPQPTLGELDGLLANVRDAGVPVETAVTGARRELPQGVELSAYRIIQEALSNVLRHAPGADTRVELSYVLGGLGVRIVNLSAGDTVSPAAASGSIGSGSRHGIPGMRERAAMLGGEMTAGPTPDDGYEVVAFLPVSAPAGRPVPAEAAS